MVSPTEIHVTYTRAGKTVIDQSEVVSDDGNSMTVKGKDSGTPGDPVDYTFHARRVAQGSAGAHKISGSWMPTGEDESDSGNLTTFKSDGDTLTMSSPDGESFTAKIGGGPCDYKGNPMVTDVVVKKSGTRTYRIISSGNGKVVSVDTITVAADGKTAKADYENKLNGRGEQVTLVKQ